VPRSPRRTRAPARWRPGHLRAAPEWNLRTGVERFQSTIAWRRSYPEQKSRTAIINEIFDGLAIRQLCALAKLTYPSAGLRRGVTVLSRRRLTGLPKRKCFLHHFSGTSARTLGKRNEAILLIWRQTNFQNGNITSRSESFKSIKH